MNPDSEFRKINDGLFSGWAGYATGLGVALALAGCTLDPDVETVGRHGHGRTVLPVNQVITPAGKQIELPEMRAQG